VTELVASPDFVVRPAEESDLNYVRKTWLTEHAQQASWIDAVGGGRVYFEEHRRLRDEAIEHGAVTIACRPAVRDGICGFAVTEQRDGVDLVHFVFVKERWRRLGVAALLLRPLADGPAFYTHLTRMASGLSKPRTWSFNPYPFLRGHS
jgi:hypothetical protein